MRKKKRIIIVGLPLFAKRLAKDLQEYKPKWKVVSLNTYYSKKDKLKALFLIPRADVVYSINGSVLQSKVFDLALKSNSNLIMNWAGTDVLKAKKTINSSRVRKDYLKKALHVCQAPWIKKELSSLGIKAKEIQYISFNTEDLIQFPFPSSFNVLCYIPENRMHFYGYDFVKTVIQKCPHINFRIVGTNKGFEDFKNVEMLGWTDDFNKEVQNAVCYLRCPEHDGLSTSVLEVMSRGRYVFYSYDYPHTIKIESSQQVSTVLKEMKSEFDNGKLQINSKASGFIEENFNYQKVMEDLVLLMNQK